MKLMKKTCNVKSNVLMWNEIPISLIISDIKSWTQDFDMSLLPIKNQMIRIIAKLIYNK